MAPMAPGFGRGSVASGVGPSQRRRPTSAGLQYNSYTLNRTDGPRGWTQRNPALGSPSLAGFRWVWGSAGSLLHHNGDRRQTPGCLESRRLDKRTYPYPTGSTWWFAVDELPVISRAYSPCQSQRGSTKPCFGPPRRGFVASGAGSALDGRLDSRLRPGSVASSQCQGRL